MYSKEAGHTRELDVPSILKLRRFEFRNGVINGHREPVDGISPGRKIGRWLTLASRATPGEGARVNFSSREIFELERFHQTKYRKFLTYISRYPVINISNFFKRLIKLGQLDQSSNCSCQTVAKMMMDALERRGITRGFLFENSVTKDNSFTIQRERERRKRVSVEGGNEESARVYLAGRDEVRQKGAGISSVWARHPRQNWDGGKRCVCARGVGQKSAVKKHTRRYTTASRRQWPPRGKVSITGGGRDNGHSKKRMFGPHNDGQRNDLSAYMLHTAACYKYPDVCPMDLDGGGRINRLSRENRLPRDDERKCFAARWPMLVEPISFIRRVAPLSRHCSCGIIYIYICERFRD